MNSFQFNPSAIAIYLNNENIKQIPQNEKLLEYFSKKIKSLFPDLKIYTNQNNEYLNKYFRDIFFLDSLDEYSFLSKIIPELPPSVSGDSDIDEVFFIYFTGIYPLMDVELTKELIMRHTKYLAQYSYSENLPAGIVPYLLTREFIISIPEKLNISTHEYLLKNINNYDTEIYYHPPDLRQFRLDFTLGDARSSNISDAFIKLNPKITYSEILPLIEKSPEIFRNAPSYLEIEIYRGCDLQCTFCPRQFISNTNDGKYLTNEFLDKLFSDFRTNFSSQMTVCFGGMGEPLLHPNLTELIETALSNENLIELIIETSLYPETENLESYILNLHPNKKKKLTFIINISTLDEKHYKEIYGKDNLKEILNKLERFASLVPNGNLHVQIIKMKEIENEIEEYFNYFEEKKINVILQKYNRYAELMPEKRVSDLTPINREFCWHLTRDLYIQFDGNVSICRQDFQNSIGNLKKESLKEIWNKGLDSFSNSIHGNHTNIKAPCLKCDEWYTFNA